MKLRRRHWLWSFLISLALVFGLSWIGYFSRRFSLLYAIGAPGRRVVSLFFPRAGYPSDWAYLYLVLAVVVDALLYMWPLLIAWRFFGPRFSK